MLYRLISCQIFFNSTQSFVRDNVFDFAGVRSCDIVAYAEFYKQIGKNRVTFINLFGKVETRVGKIKSTAVLNSEVSLTFEYAYSLLTLGFENPISSATSMERTICFLLLRT